MFRDRRKVKEQCWDAFISQREKETDTQTYKLKNKTKHEHTDR